MASGNVPPQRREVVVRGDGNCFYRAIALWRDEMTDEKHEEIRRLSSTLIEKNPKVFQPLLFSSNSVKEHVKRSKITGTWAETVDIFSCASLLKRPICTFSTSQKKWFTFKPIMITDSCSSITTKKQCRCPITLMYYDIYAQANHFNLLLPQGSCCSAPLPENTASSVSIDLSNTGKSYASAVKQTSQASSSVKLTSTSTKAAGSKQPCQASTSYNTTASSSCTKPRVKKPSKSPKATAPTESSSIKQPTPVSKPTTAKAPSSVKQQTPVTKPTTDKQTYPLKQPTPAGNSPTNDKHRPPTSTFQQPVPGNKMTAAKHPSSVKQQAPATTPTTAKQPYSSSTMTSSQISTDKPTVGKEPSSNQAITSTSTNENKNNDNDNDNDNNNNNLDFDKMDVKEIKGFISARGVQASTYRKPELIQLAKAVASMNLPTDPDFENDSIEKCLLRRLTLPAGQKLSDPFQMTSLSNDFSQLPPFGLMDIFNHLIMSKADYDKRMLSSWRSFEEYNLCSNGHIQNLGVKTVQDLDGSNFFVFVAGVIPTQKEKTQEGEKLYRLWFILDSNGSVYSAFCRCKGGADQGCRHLGATLFELDDFLSNQRKSVTSMSAYWNPKPTPKHKPVPISDMKISFSNVRKKKRKITPYDDSWIDSFDPRPMKQRREPTHEEKMDFARKLRKIDPCSGILDFLPSSKDYMYYLKLRCMSGQILISFQKTICYIVQKNF